MLFKKLLRTFGKYKAQFISMIVMVFLGVAIFAGFNAEWYSIDIDTNSLFQETELADYHVYNSKGIFSLEDVDKIAAIDGVDKATRFMEVETTESKEKEIIKLAVSENFSVSIFTLIEGEEYDGTLDNAVWLSNNYAKRNDYHVGDSIILTYGTVSKELVIKGICMSGEYLINLTDNAMMPDYDKVGFAYTTPVVYSNISLSIMGMVYYNQINVKSNLDNETFSKAVDDALGFTAQVVSKEDTTSYSEASGESDEGKTMGLLLPVIFLLIAVLTMVTTMNRITTNEKTQIGILKALGYKNRRIVWHYTCYALAIGLLGTILGIAVGYPLCTVFFSQAGSMGTYFEMPTWTVHMPWFVFVGSIAIVGFLTLIGFLSVKKQLKGSAAEALRPYEPPKMKKMLLEKSKTFHKLNFATRWNLRDISRHKARTIVSIFGVFGCTLLLFASFGMVSTMNNYIDVNYNVQLNYETAISLNEKITKEKALSLVEKYDGDYDTSIATKIDGKTHIMTIFNYDKDHVRLINNNKRIKDVSSEGVYVCQRMKDELNCKKGDTITLSIYGETTKYDVVVAGYYASNTVGFALSEEYADKLSIPHSISKIYTSTTEDQIASDADITSTMSKQTIMKSFDTFIEIMDMMIVILVIFSALLAFVVLYNLGTMSFMERYRELATLKVLGFKDKKIRNILISQNMWSTVVGTVIGVPVGYGTLVLLYKLLAAEYELTVFVAWYAYVVAIVATILVSLFVSWLASRKVKKIDMVEALKAE